MNANNLFHQDTSQTGPQPTVVFDVLVKQYNGQTKFNNIQRFFEGMSLDEIRQWFEKENNKFHYFCLDSDKKIENVSVYVPLRICLQHGPSTKCTRSNCSFLHMCRNFIAGHCNKSNLECDIGHTFLLPHNKDILRRHHLLKYSEPELKLILRKSLPWVCSYYNSGRCRNKVCSSIHICSSCIVSGSCEKVNCTLDHDFSSDHTQLLLKMFRLCDTSELMIRRIILVKMYPSKKINYASPIVTEEPNVIPSKESSARSASGTRARSNSLQRPDSQNRRDVRSGSLSRLPAQNTQNPSERKYNIKTSFSHNDDSEEWAGPKASSTVPVLDIAKRSSEGSIQQTRKLNTASYLKNILPEKPLVSRGRIQHRPNLRHPHLDISQTLDHDLETLHSVSEKHSSQEMSNRTDSISTSRFYLQQFQSPHVQKAPHHHHDFLNSYTPMYPYCREQIDDAFKAEVRNSIKPINIQNDDRNLATMKTCSNRHCPNRHHWKIQLFGELYRMNQKQEAILESSFKISKQIEIIKIKDFGIDIAVDLDILKANTAEGDQVDVVRKCRI